MAKTIDIAGGNNITLSTATALNATSFTISGANVGGAQTGISGLSNSETMYTSGSVKLSDLANITIRSTTGQAFQFSVHPQQTAISGLGNSETTYTSGTVNLSVVGGQLTIRSTTGNAFQFSASQSVQAETQTFLGALKNSETTYTSGTVGLSELGAITIRSTTGNQFQLSVNAQTNQSAIKGLGVSNTGNTAGNTGLSSGIDWVVGGSNMVTASESTAIGGPNTIWLNATQTVQTQAITADQVSVGVSTGGNTAGNTTVQTGNRLVFIGSNMVSISEATGAGSTTLQFSATQSVQTQGVTQDELSIGVSNLGNTLGNTTVNSGQRMVFVGTDGLSLSQATGAGSTTVTWDPGPALGSWNNMGPAAQANSTAPIGNVACGSLVSTMGVYPLTPNGPFPGTIRASTMMLLIELSDSTATMSAAFTNSYSVGIYTRSASTLNLLNSVSTAIAFGAAATNNSTGFASRRWLTFASSQWSAAPTFTRGEYYIATIWKSAGSSMSLHNIFGQNIANSALANQPWGTAGVSANTAVAGSGFRPFMGNYSAGTGAFPAAISSNDLSKSNAAAVQMPGVWMIADAPQSF